MERHAGAPLLRLSGGAAATRATKLPPQRAVRPSELWAVHSVERIRGRGTSCPEPTRTDVGLQRSGAELTNFDLETSHSVRAVASLQKAAML